MSHLAIYFTTSVGVALVLQSVSIKQLQLPKRRNDTIAEAELNYNELINPIHI